MYNKFTKRAQKVILLAQQEAKKLNHDYLGTEHLLLGLLTLNEGVAAEALRVLRVLLHVHRERRDRLLSGFVLRNLYRL